MGRTSLSMCHALLLLLLVTPLAHADLQLAESKTARGSGGSSSSSSSSKSSKSSRSSSSSADSSSSVGGGGAHHHPRVTVTGVEVGVVASPEAEADEAAAAASPEASAAEGAPNLIGDLISAASGESNGTLAQVLDKALAKEFEQESKNAENGKGKTYNETVANEEAKVETVVRISAGKQHEKEEEEDSSGSSGSGSGGSSPTDGPVVASSSGAAGSSKNTSSRNSSASGTPSSSHSGHSGHSSHAEKEAPSLEKGVDRIIDSQDNEFVLSAPPKDQVATLTLDPLLIQDLTLLFASAALMGILFESLKQPVINGYLVAGAIVGPGGLQLIKELVQVESLAQLGVQLLLFHLGRELSFAKLKAVWSVALLGGMLQIVALSAVGGVVAAVLESPVTQGIFVGALLSMSSTSVVVKCLESYRMNATAFGQITIGTLILQDCSVGIMFALMPAFGAAAARQAPGAVAEAAAAVAAGAAPQSAVLEVSLLICTVMIKLVMLVAAAWAVARLVLPQTLQLLLRHASGEVVQLSLVSMCLCSAWLCGRLGLSEELGAFIAGAMMAMAEQRLVSSGHMLPSSSNPHTPRAKGHLSAPDSPTNVAAAVLPKAGGAKHNSAAVAYYRHATQRQQQQQQQQQQHPQPGQHRASLHDAEVGDVIAAVHNLESPSLTAQLHDLHQQQHQALLSGQPGNGRYTPEQSNNSPSCRGSTGHPSSEAHSPSVCANIESIQNVLTALFVASMGLIMSPVFLWHHAGVLLCGTLVVTVLKAAVVTLVVRMFDVPLRLSLAVGLSMAHIGEFSFVLLSMANQLKLLSTQVYMLLLGVTAMSLLTTPVVIMTSIHFVAKEGHHQVYITGPRLRLSCERE